jgi:hypothetical protein
LLDFWELLDFCESLELLDFCILEFLEFLELLSSAILTNPAIPNVEIQQYQKKSSKSSIGFLNFGLAGFFRIAGIVGFLNSGIAGFFGIAGIVGFLNSGIAGLFGIAGIVGFLNSAISGIAGFFQYFTVPHRFRPESGNSAGMAPEWHRNPQE